MDRFIDMAGSRGRRARMVDDAWLAPALAIAAWLPAMFAAAAVWRHGQYYDYGWFVPPAAIGLTVLRWRDSKTPIRRIPRYWIGVWLMLLPCILVLRILGHVDPSWRLPILLLGGTGAIMAHAVLASARGWRESASYLCITLLWASALPWPSVVESGMIHWLTDQVVAASAEVFHWFGRPVEVLGGRLQLHETTVEVTDGCSGVRSFQSFLMATWFFAEWQRLRPDRVWILLLCACVTGFLVNMGRTILLALVRFDHGEAAFRQAHDVAGFIAFAAGAVIFYLLSGLLATNRRVLVRTSVSACPGGDVLRKTR